MMKNLICAISAMALMASAALREQLFRKDRFGAQLVLEFRLMTQPLIFGKSIRWTR